MRLLGGCRKYLLIGPFVLGQPAEVGYWALVKGIKVAFGVFSQTVQVEGAVLPPQQQLLSPALQGSHFAFPRKGLPGLHRFFLAQEDIEGVQLHVGLAGLADGEESVFGALVVANDNFLDVGEGVFEAILSFPGGHAFETAVLVVLLDGDIDLVDGEDAVASWVGGGQEEGKGLKAEGVPRLGGGLLELLVLEELGGGDVVPGFHAGVGEDGVEQRRPLYPLIFFI